MEVGVHMSIKTGKIYLALFFELVVYYFDLGNNYNACWCIDVTKEAFYQTADRLWFSPISIFNIFLAFSWQFINYCKLLLNGGWVI